MIFIHSISWRAIKLGEWMFKILKAVIVPAMKPFFSKNWMFLPSWNGIFYGKQHKLGFFNFWAAWGNFLSQMPMRRLLNLPAFTMKLSPPYNFKSESEVFTISKCMSTVRYNSIKLMHWMCWNFVLALQLTKLQNALSRKRL